MKNQLRFAALFLIASAVFAQRGGGFRGSSPTVVGHANRGVAPTGVRRISGRIEGRRSGFRQRGFGNGFFSPYYPFLEGYAPDYVPEPDYFPAGNAFEPQASAPEMSQSRAPVETAHAVVQEYNWKNQSAAAGGEQTTFTIALKDGSMRSAVVTWVQGRTLHYTDSDEKQGVLSADLIDRDTTRRLNRAKKLSIQLPPG